MGFEFFLSSFTSAGRRARTSERTKKERETHEKPKQEMWLPYFMTIVHEKLHEIFKNCQDNRLQRLIICYINFLFCFGSIYGT